MVGEEEKHLVENETLRIQLAELNSRSRLYSSQLWQLPFAYLGLTGIVLAGFADNTSLRLAVALFACGIFGLCVVFHMCGMRDGERRAVDDLQEIEGKLYLEETAEYKPLLYVVPLQVAVIGAMIVYFAGSLCLVCLLLAR